MKTILFLFLLFRPQLSPDTQTTTPLQPLLENYLQLKDALIKSDSKKAVELASKLQLAIEDLKQNELEMTVQQHFSSVRTGLLSAVQKIAKKADLEKQRSAFGEISPLLWPLFKASGNAGLTIYYDYCPMKKAYWLSSEATIKNPYFGAAMLSCGSIAEQKN